MTWSQDETLLSKRFLGIVFEPARQVLRFVPRNGGNEIAVMLNWDNRTRRVASVQVQGNVDYTYITLPLVIAIVNQNLPLAALAARAREFSNARNAAADDWESRFWQAVFAELGNQWFQNPDAEQLSASAQRRLSKLRIKDILNHVGVTDRANIDGINRAFVKVVYNCLRRGSVDSRWTLIGNDEAEERRLFSGLCRDLSNLANQQAGPDEAAAADSPEYIAYEPHLGQSTLIPGRRRLLELERCLFDNHRSRQRMLETNNMNNNNQERGDARAGGAGAGAGERGVGGWRQFAGNALRQEVRKWTSQVFYGAKEYKRMEMPVLGFGKWSGLRVSEVPQSYLKYLTCFAFARLPPRIIGERDRLQLLDGMEVGRGTKVQRPPGARWLRANQIKIVRAARMYLRLSYKCVYCMNSLVRYSQYQDVVGDFPFDQELLEWVDKPIPSEDSVEIRALSAAVRDLYPGAVPMGRDPRGADQASVPGRNRDLPWFPPIVTSSSAAAAGGGGGDDDHQRIFGRMLYDLPTTQSLLRAERGEDPARWCPPNNRPGGAELVCEAQLDDLSGNDSGLVLRYQGGSLQSLPDYLMHASCYESVFASIPAIAM